ncbi:MAG: Arylsulfatase precursor [Planctomycetes bacterium ADurb.Bin126]|nr:MAG: Arylsulfatase precursor [Planctomycetes bacterium ADurb.Bin126]HOD83640.1 arylsulfatase [Phycisphaerae bacterium]HQL72305.1 arylsulfatase [Phycisphaerae bacterium]
MDRHCSDRREFLLGAVGAAAAMAWPGVARSADPAAKADRPNILLIVADDLGWGHVGWQGSKIRTPNLDKLAAEGIQLNRHYVAPVCSPTRSALMTGRYWSRFGVTNPENRRCLPWDTVTLASALKSVGYETAISGKWHLGSKPEWGPRKFGFEHSYGSLAGGLGPYTHLYRKGEFQRTWHRNDEYIDEEGHVTDLFAGEIVRRVEAGGDRPLFLYLPFTAPHFPCSEPKEWMDFNPEIPDPSLRLYGAAVSHMDDAIGRIVAALKKKGKWDNTLVIFFGDNGAPGQNNHGAYPGEYQKLKLPGTNLPLRGRKGDVYEGGIRTPALVHWPAGLKSGRCDAPLHVIDWMPTLCGLAGYKADKNLKWDGQDVLAVIRAQTRPPERTLYCKGPGNQAAVFRGAWKLIVGKKEPELYNLDDDMGEKTNLAEKQPDRVAELTKAYEDVKARDNDAVAR